MSTSQRVVMLCGWGVKASMACLQVKLRVAALENAFSICIWRFTNVQVYFYFTFRAYFVRSGLSW